MSENEMWEYGESGVIIAKRGAFYWVEAAGRMVVATSERDEAIAAWIAEVAHA